MKCLTGEEMRLVLQAVKDRKDFIVSQPHILAYYLDPKYSGFGLSRGDRKLAEDYFCKGDEKQKDRTFTELNNFVEYCSNLGCAIFFLWLDIDLDRWRKKQLACRNKTALQFWVTEGDGWPSLQIFALSLFVLTPSSAASERNFSSMAFLHNKVRNRLGAGKVNKLLFVRTNVIAASTTTELVDAQTESERDESDTDVDQDQDPDI